VCRRDEQNIAAKTLDTSRLTLKVSQKKYIIYWKKWVRFRRRISFPWPISHIITSCTLQSITKTEVRPLKLFHLSNKLSPIFTVKSIYLVHNISPWHTHLTDRTTLNYLLFLEQIRILIPNHLTFTRYWNNRYKSALCKSDCTVFKHLKCTLYLVLIYYVLKPTTNITQRFRVSLC
jgi:hypothetical protein